MIKDLGNGLKIETYETAEEMIAAMDAPAKEAATIAKKNEKHIQAMLESGVLSCPCRIATNGHIELITIPDRLAQLDYLQRAVAEAPAQRGTIEIIACGQYSWIVNEDGRLNGSKKNQMFPMFYGSIVLMLTADIY
jgi:hypothetical protein